MQSFHFDTIDSTNEAAKRLLRGGAVQDRAIILAREQTHGKGSNGRSWLSPRDAGIYMSFIRRAAPGHPLPSTTWFTLAAGLACAESLERVVKIDVRMKPINDLYVADRKLGGVLSEAIFEDDAMLAIIIGLGINIARAHRCLPPDHPAATSLEELMPPDSYQRLPRDELTESLAAALDLRISQIVGGESDAVRRDYERRMQPGFKSPFPVSPTPAPSENAT